MFNKRRLWVKVAHLFRYIKRLNGFTYFLITFSAFIGIAMFLLSTFLSSLVYEPEMSTFLNESQLTLLIFVPFYLGYFVIFIFIKIIADTIHRKEGALLRTQMLIYFLIASILPSVVMIRVFDNLLNSTFNEFFSETIITSMDTTLKTMKETVYKYQKESIKELGLLSKAKIISYKEGGFVVNTNEIISHLESRKFDYIFIYDQNKLLFTEGRGIVTENLKKIMSRHLESADLKSTKKYYSDYVIERDYIVSILPLSRSKGEVDKISGYLCSMVLLSPDFSSRAVDTLNTIRRIKQFQFLKNPLKTIIIFLYIYFFVPLLGIGFFFFYFVMSTLTEPLKKLIVATKMVAVGDFSFRVRYEGDNEIKRLVNSFNTMSKQLRENQLSQARNSRLEAWKSVAVRLAHEMKNPLTPLFLARENAEQIIMQRDFDTYSAVVKDFNIIKEEGQKIQNLVKEFSNFSKEMQIIKENFKFSEIFDSLLNQFERQSRFDGKVIISHSKTIEFLGDKNKLSQVISNLVLNSIESIGLTSENGEKKFIRVQSEIQKIDDLQCLVVTVTDNGVGISSEKQCEIFKPYFTTKAKGTGLGLCICEQIVASHGGSISFTSDPDETLFRIELPLTNKDS